MIIFIDSNIVLDVMLPNPKMFVESNAVLEQGVDETCILNALDSDWKDFEDSVQHQVAQQIMAEIIVTRNTEDYALSSVRVMTPKEFLKFAQET